MSITDRPVLITGGTGFIGSHVARALLDRGRRVCLADIRGLSPEAKFVLGRHAATVPVEHASIDNWPRLLEVVRHWQPRQVVHIGGIVDPLFLFKNPSVALRVNVEGTVNVLECIRQSAVERIVYYLQFVEPAVRGEKVRLASGGPLPRDNTHVRDIANLTAAVLDAPDDADRVFYAATGKPLVTAAQAAKLVMELVPGADIEIGDVLSEDDQVELGFRGVLSIENARPQLGWQPTYSSLRDGIAEYVATYRTFLAGNK